MSYFDWPEYVSVAERKLRAKRELERLRKQRRVVSPVSIEGRKIAESFWGVSWCSNLEHYSDYETRLPRGRSYVRNGFVVDLQIAKQKVTAMVSGSKLYNVKVSISPVPRSRWKAICRDCAGSIDSLVELLQGRLAKAVMERVCRKDDGLFPAPKEIKFSCTCPDSANMCKHVAAALYGIGARVDEQPQLLFLLRGVNEGEMLAGADQRLSQATPAPKSDKVLAESDVAALFGLEMAETGSPSGPIPRAKAGQVGQSGGEGVQAPTTLVTDNGNVRRRARGSRGPKSKGKDTAAPRTRGRALRAP